MQTGIDEYLQAVEQSQIDSYLDIVDKFAFCPTGEGGGIDPTCSPRESGGDGEAKSAVHVAGTVYHGTGARAASNIKSKGLKAGKPLGDRPAAVYFTTSQKFAKEFGEFYVEGAGKTFAVVEFKIPASASGKIFRDKAPSMKRSFGIASDIPASWIKSIKLYDSDTGKLVQQR